MLLQKCVRLFFILQSLKCDPGIRNLLLQEGTGPCQYILDRRSNLCFWPKYNTCIVGNAINSSDSPSRKESLLNAFATNNMWVSVLVAALVPPNRSMRLLNTMVNLTVRQKSWSRRSQNARSTITISESVLCGQPKRIDLSSVPNPSKSNNLWSYFCIEDGTSLDLKFGDWGDTDTWWGTHGGSPHTLCGAQMHGGHARAGSPLYANVPSRLVTPPWVRASYHVWELSSNDRFERHASSIRYHFVSGKSPSSKEEIPLQNNRYEIVALEYQTHGCLMFWVRRSLNSPNETMNTLPDTNKFDTKYWVLRTMQLMHAYLLEQTKHKHVKRIDKLIFRHRCVHCYGCKCWNESLVQQRHA